MVIIRPVALFRAEQVGLDQVARQWRKGQAFKAKHGSITAFNVFCRRDILQILDANTVRAFLVETRLVRNDHARHKRRGIPGFCDPLRAFMHAEINADAVPRAMIIIEARLPQRMTG